MPIKKVAPSLEGSLAGIKKMQNGAAAPAEIKRQAKSTDSDYIAMKVFVRKDLRRQAIRKWEDDGGSSDYSDLLEHLFHEYLGSQRPKAHR